MKLTAKVDEVKRISGRGLVFGARTAGGGFLHDVSNIDNFAVDDEVVVLVLTKEQAAALSSNLDLVVSHGYAEFAALADQLRPDPPVPFLEPSRAAQDAWEKRHCVQPDEAVTQEFVREVEP